MKAGPWVKSGSGSETVYRLPSDGGAVVQVQRVAQRWYAKFSLLVERAPLVIDANLQAVLESVVAELRQRGFEVDEGITPLDTKVSRWTYRMDADSVRWVRYASGLIVGSVWRAGVRLHGDAPFRFDDEGGTLAGYAEHLTAGEGNRNRLEVSTVEHMKALVDASLAEHGWSMPDDWVPMPSEVVAAEAR